MQKIVIRKNAPSGYQDEKKPTPKQVFPSTGCWSPIGYRAGRINQISLGSGCHWKDVVMHEMAHTLGFFHEQARPDRDRYVRILWNNVIPEQKYNFEKQSVNSVETLRYIFLY